MAKLAASAAIWPYIRVSSRCGIEGRPSPTLGAWQARASLLPSVCGPLTARKVTGIDNWGACLDGRVALWSPAGGQQQQSRSKGGLQEVVRDLADMLAEHHCCRRRPVHCVSEALPVGALPLHPMRRVDQRLYDGGVAVRT